MIISVGSIAANATLGISTFTANADKVIEKAFKVQSSLNGIAQKAAAAGRTFTIMAVGGTLAAKNVGGAFLKAASDIEMYTVVMESVTKSTEETTRFMKDLTHYAAATPFELNEIMSSATVLTATFKGNTDEIRRWLPALADLGAMAKLRGIDFERTALQFQRMITQGAGAVDLFRDAGILSMLGIDAKVDTDIVKMREKMFQVLTDADGIFKGLAEKAASTFTGLISQVADQWFIFRSEIMKDSGLFDDLKSGLLKFLSTITENRRAVVDYIAAHKEMVETVIIGTAVVLSFATGMTVLGFIIPPLSVSFGILSSSIGLVTKSIYLMGIGIGLTEAVAAPLAAAITALVVVAGIAAYSFRAFGGDLTKVSKGIETLGLVLNPMKALFTVASDAGLTFANTLSLISLESARAKKAILEVADGLQVPGLFGSDPHKLFNIDPSTIEKAGKDVEEALKTFKSGLNKPQSEDKTGWFDGLGKKMMDGLSVWGEKVWDQFKKDGTSALSAIEDKVPGLKKLLEESKQVDLKQTDWNSLLGSPDFTKPGMKLSEGVKKGVDKAAQELERLQDKGRTVFENLFPAEGAMTDVIDRITALKAIGRDSPEVMRRLQADVAENFKGTNSELAEVEQRLLAMGGAAAIVGDNLSAIKDQAAIDEVNLQAQEALAQFSQWQYAVDTFNQKLIDLTATAEQMGQSLAPEDITVAVRDLADSLGVDTVSEVEKLEKALSKLGSPAKLVFTEIRDKIKETKMEKFNDQFVELTRAVSGLGPKFKTMATVAETSFKIIRAAQAAATLGFNEILNLVIEIINAMGLLGGETEKSMSDMDKFMDDLASTAEQVADRMTDAIVEFARTGKAEVGDLVDFILQEFLRAGISNLIINPAVNFIGDALFAKGGAFKDGEPIPAAKGHVTTGPELFQFRSGQIGVRGEAGSEAILPLKRSGGILGVQSTAGPAPIVNIYNNGLPEGSVSVNQYQSDGQNIVDVILDVVRVGLLDGSLNSAMRGAR